MKFNDKAFLLDVIIHLLLGALAGHVAYSIVGAHWSTAQFHQTWFGPAVSLACGRGFVDVNFSGIESLTRFLTMNTDHFSCAQLPAGELPVRPKDHWTDFQLDHLYLMGALGLLWRMTGIEWQSLAIVAGLLNAIMIMSAYALFRLGMGRLAAIAMTILLLCSPNVANHLTAYRDYSKAPFIILSLFGIGLMVLRGGERRFIAIASALAGLSIGVGVGFRQDSLIIVPLFVTLSTLFLPNGPVTRAPKDWLTAVFCFGAFFTIGSAGVLPYLLGGANSWHVAMLGLLSEFTPFYKVVLSPFYEWVNHPSDGYVEHLVNAHEILVRHSSSPVSYQTSEYDRAAFMTYRTIVWTTPYDYLLRMAGVFDLVCALPFQDKVSQSSPLAAATAIAPLLGFRGWLSALGGMGGATLVLLAAFTTMARNLRIGLALLFTAIYLGTYPTLQNQPRHIFHLEILGLSALGMALSHAYAVLAAARVNAINAPESWRLAKKTLAVTLSAALLAFVTLRAAHALQQHNLKNAVAALTSVEGRLLPITDIEWENNSVIVSPFEYADQPHPYYKAWYISVDFDLARCGVDSLTAKIFYHAKKGYNTYTSTFTLAGRSKKWKVMAPVFESDVSVFRGVEIPANARACLESVHDISGLAEKAGVLPYLYLPETWRDEDFAMKSSIETLF